MSRRERSGFDHSWLELPKTRLDVTGVLGQRLDVKLQTQDLDELKPLLGGVKLPFRLDKGSVAANGSVAGPLANPTDRRARRDSERGL